MASVTAELIIEASANTDEAQRNLAQFNDRVALVSTALGIVAAGAIAAGVALVDFARQAAEEQEQVNRLAFALENAGIAAEQGLGRLDRFMLVASRATGFSDEQLREALTLFASYSSALEPSIGQIEEAGALIADIARQTGKSLPEISMVVSKAFAGNATAIGELNPALRGAAEEIMGIESAAIRGERAMALLRGQFEGSATATANAGTQMQVLVNEFGDLQQSIGRAVLRSGEFNDAIDTTLATLRDLDAEINDPTSGTSRAIEDTGILFGALADAVSYASRSIASFYPLLVDIGEASLASGAAVIGFLTPFKGILGSQSEVAAFAESMGRVGDSLGEWLGDTAAGRLIGFTNDTRDLANETEGVGFAWQFVGDAQDRALSRGMQMIPEVEARAASLYEQLRGFAFDGFEDVELAPRRAGPAAPENDEERKVKDSLVAIEEARRAAAEQQIADEQAKQQALLELQKAAEEQRMEAERIANEQRVTAAKEASAAIVAAELADAEKRAAIERELAQQRANIAGLAANAAVGALDIILDGERKSGRERRKELGTFIAAQGRGYLLQAIPEAFLNPARASALAIGGGAMVAFGAALGGRVFGGSGGGGGGGSAGGSGFGSGGTGLSLPTTTTAQAQPVVVNDFAGAMVVANDPDAFRGVARRTDDARQGGLGGAL